MGSDGLAGALLDALPDPTAVLDHSGDILAVNRAWQMFAVVWTTAAGPGPPGWA
jgi:hypothetical protein